VGFRDDVQEHTNGNEAGVDAVATTENSAEPLAAVDPDAANKAGNGRRKKFGRSSSLRTHAHLHKWIPKHDPSSGKTYYFNAETGTSQWEEPDEVRDAREADEKGEVDFLRAFTQGGAITSRMRRQSVAVESKGNWTVMRDPKSKCVFYYNSETGVSQWNQPPGFEATGPSRRARRRSVVIGRNGQWELMRDPVSHRTFYHNRELNKSQWHKPAGFGDDVHDGETASRSSRLRPSKDLPERGILIAQSGDWKLILDPDSERVSYHNEFFEEARWDMPAEFESNLAAVPAGAVSRSKKIEEFSRGDADEGGGNNGGDSGESLWYKMQDPENGDKCFYFNPQRKVSQWDRPPESTTKESDGESAGKSAGAEKTGVEESEKSGESMSGVDTVDVRLTQENKGENTGAETKEAETKEAETKEAETKEADTKESIPKTAAATTATTKKSGGKKKAGAKKKKGLGGSLRKARARRKKLA
jgi:hypothetical protein